MDFGALELSGITRRYGRETVVAEISLSIQAGESCALLGPARSGKSVVMRILAGFETPSSGTIELSGQPLAKAPPHRRDFGVVQQPDALLPELSLAENIGLPLLIRRMAARHRRPLVETLLEQTHLRHASGLKPGQATAAERQRAMLARACVFAPRVLLLDEPFSLQDPRERQQMIAALRQMQLMFGATTVLATRDPSLALALTHGLAVLRDGRVEQAGSTRDVFERPETAFVAGLLGETNRLDGHVAELEDDLATVRLACGPLVEAMPGGVLTPGQACVVCIRPGHIAVAQGPAAELGGTALDATVIETRFAGADMRMRLLIGSGTEVIVIRPAAAGARRLVAGDQAALAWQPHHAVVFAAPAA